MAARVKSLLTRRTIAIDIAYLKPSPFSVFLYGDATTGIDDLMASVREQGILVALVVASGADRGTWEVLSGNRRLACARALGLTKVPCEVRCVPPGPERRRAVLEYNRQRSKTFSELMREADALEELLVPLASARRLGNLRRGPSNPLGRSDDIEGRNSDDRITRSADNQSHARRGPTQEGKPGRTDATIAQYLGIGGKDIYRQARSVWRLARTGDVRAASAVAQLDSKRKTIHSVYKDMRRRERFTTGFRPTPYDVWSFRHDPAFGIPYPGSIPPAVVAHTLHYYTSPGALVVDPMAGGGTTLDVCQSMGRRCLAYDLQPARPDVQCLDVRLGLPDEASGCDLIFCDPPYHTMLARQYSRDGIAAAPLTDWIAFLHTLARHAFSTLRPGGYLSLLLAAQTEKDLPAGFGYLDHAFFAYIASVRAGFLPERRITCPMNGAYLPQQVRSARNEGRLLGQVRDLLVMRKPSRNRENTVDSTLFMRDVSSPEAPEAMPFWHPPFWRQP
jgi:hypothetical protein